MEPTKKLRGFIRLGLIALIALAAADIIPGEIGPVIEERSEEITLAILAITEGWFWQKARKGEA